ncbi:MucBP domain-containing protein [Enterococcus ureasiticus]|uniref:MucBP domain-containing protein n=1 Tax=Enterococcus ureasiticus TaxID=903984 RepID=UPI001A8CBF22|nr:MucBP domain-containing protein [Enterococcus ureasiticus]MBO0472183.1 MucBP domain-containing protein [Enterococcus ureasiticus]
MKTKRIVAWMMFLILMVQFVAETTISMVAVAEQATSETTETPSQSTEEADPILTDPLIDETSMTASTQNESKTEASIATKESETNEPSTSVEETKTSDSTEITNDTPKLNQIITDNLFQSIKLYKNDNTEMNTSDTFVNGAGIKMVFNFAFSNKNYQIGDTWSTQLPEQINIAHDLSGSFAATNSASWTIDAATKKLTITFLLNNVSDASYDLTVSTGTNRINATKEENQTLVFDTASGKKTYNLEMLSDIKKGLNETKAILDRDFNTRAATIESQFNLERSTADNRYFVIRPDSRFDSTSISNVKVYSSVVDFNGKLEGAKTLLKEGADYSVEITGQNTIDPQAKIIMKNSLTKKAIIVTNEILDIDAINLNKSDAIGNMINTFRIEARTCETIAGQADSELHMAYNHQPHFAAYPLEISGVFNKETGNVDWTIFYNYHERNLTSANSLTAVIKDTGLEYVGNSLSIRKSEFIHRSNGNYTLKDVGDGSSDIKVSMETNGSFKMDYLKSTTQAYTIKYSTKNTNPAVRYVTNTVNDGNKTELNSIKITTDFLNKEAGSIDLFNQTMAWTITVNSGNATLTNAYLEDFFLGAVQDYTDLLVQVKGSDDTLTDLSEGIDYTLTKFQGSSLASASKTSGNALAPPAVHNGGVRVNFIGKYASFTDTIQINLVTKLNITKAKETVKNKVILHADEIPDDIEFDASGVFETPYADGGKILFEQTKGDEYYYQDWLVLVNLNGENNGNASIQNSLDDNVELMPETLRYEEIDSTEMLNNIKDYIVKDKKLAQPGDAVYPTKSNIAKSDDIVYSNKNSITDTAINLEFDNLGEKRLAIKYRTRFKDRWHWEKAITNKATMTLGNKSKDLSVKANPLISHTAVKKTVLKDPDSKNVANWEIQTKDISNILQVKDPVITDTLDNAKTNASYDPTSFVVTESATGNRLDPDLYDLEVHANRFKITFKNYTATSNFKVNYSTISEYTGKLQSKVEIASDSYETLPDYFRVVNVPITLDFTNGSGEGIVKIADFTLTKVDANDSSKLLEGAVFEIFTTDNNPTGLKVTTDVNGKAEFEGLPVADYLLKEIQAPEKYDISQEYQDGKLITIDEDNATNTVTVTNKLAPVPATIVVKYQDDAGKDLATSDTFNGFVGEAYVTTEKTIKNWSIKTIPANANGVYTDTPQEIIYVYERNDAEPVTVRHQDKDGNKLAEPDVLNGKVGLPYETTEKKISGWKMKTKPENAKGTFKEGAQEVVYVYEKEELQLPEDPAVTPPKDNTDDSKGKTKLPSTNTTTVDNNKKKLPQTGETATNNLWIIGLMMLMFIIGDTMVVNRKKQ